MLNSGACKFQYVTPPYLVSAEHQNSIINFNDKSKSVAVSLFHGTQHMDDTFLKEKIAKTYFCRDLVVALLRQKGFAGFYRNMGLMRNDYEYVSFNENDTSAFKDSELLKFRSNLLKNIKQDDYVKVDFLIKQFLKQHLPLFELLNILEEESLISKEDILSAKNEVFKILTERYNFEQDTYQNAYKE
jgi:hypothetical protein